LTDAQSSVALAVHGVGDIAMWVCCMEPYGGDGKCKYTWVHIHARLCTARGTEPACHSSRVTRAVSLRGSGREESGELSHCGGVRAYTWSILGVIRGQQESRSTGKLGQVGWGVRVQHGLRNRRGSQDSNMEENRPRRMHTTTTTTTTTTVPSTKPSSGDSSSQCSSEYMQRKACSTGYPVAAQPRRTSFSHARTVVAM
jgi:hypothetical protein